MTTAQTTISIVVIAEDSPITGLIEDVSVTEGTRSGEATFEATLFADVEGTRSGEATFENPGLISVEGTRAGESTSETPIAGGGGQQVISVSVGSNLVELESSLFADGTIVRWSTTGTFPDADLPINPAIDYYLGLFDIGLSQYLIYEFPSFDSPIFDDQGTGTHTLTEQP